MAEDPQPPAKRRRGGQLRGGKSSNPEFRAATILVRKSHYLDARTILARRGRFVSDLIDELLGEWLQAQHQSGKNRTN